MVGTFYGIYATMREELKVAAQDRVKIVMTSAMGFPQGGVKALHSQCDAYITKPITKEKLVEALNNLGFP